MPETDPTIEDQIAEKRSVVDGLRSQIALAKKGQAQVVSVEDDNRRLERLDAEEARLRAELEAVQAGVVAEPVVPDEEVEESAVPTTTSVTTTSDDDARPASGKDTTATTPSPTPSPTLPRPPFGGGSSN